MPNAAWIRTTSLVATLGWMVTGSACGTSSASTGTDSQNPLAVNSASQAEAAPPHVFTPRPHPARIHEPPPAPDMARLPPLVDQTTTCFASAVEEPPTWTRPSRGGKKRTKKKKRKRRPPGFVPYGGGKGGGGSKPSKSSKSSGGVPGGVVGGVSGGVLGGASGSGRVDKRDTKPSRRPKPKTKSKDRAPKAEPAPAPEAEPPPPAVMEMDDADPSAALPDDRAAGEAQGPVAIATDHDEGFDDWGSVTYLSNDDTMSLSSAQRVIYAIDNFLPLPAEHIRPHELLNYFSFQTTPVGRDDDFSVDASIAPDPHEEGIYSLAMAVKGRPLSLEDRRNTNLSIVIDRSGSMSADGRMEYLKRGLNTMMGELKRGDMVHLVFFDDEVCTPVKNFVVGRDRPQVLHNAINRLEPRGSTNLHDGLRSGYELADRSYQSTYSNRVVMITDAIVNTGVTDSQLISTVSKFYDDRRIRLSGVGVGRDFNDALLDKLTERGKGAYVFLGSEAEVDAVFGPRFTSLIETTALDVHFRLHLPPSLRMNTFYGEESSTFKEDVQAIHYFANTSQLFLSDLMAKGGQLRGQDSVMLTVEYEDPETGDERVEEYAFNLGEISEGAANVRKGRMIMHFVDGLAWMAARNQPSAWGRRDGSWDDADAWEACEAGREQLATMARGLDGDPEVRRVTELWDKYCARYSRPVDSNRRPPPDTWPSAAGG